MSPRKRTPEQESLDTKNEIETAIAVAETPAAEGAGDGPGFAERIGQRKWTPAPDPFGLATDNVAGVRLFESREDRQMAIMFGEGRAEDKPSQAVIDTMKDAGYRWNPTDKIWAHPLRYESAMTTRIEAKQLYEKVCQMIRQEKGIAAVPELPF